MTDTDTAPIAEPVETVEPTRTNRLALWSVLAVLVLGIAAIGVVARSHDDLPKLRLGAAGANERTSAMADMALRPMGPIEYRLGAPLPELPDKAAAYTLGAAPKMGGAERLVSALGMSGGTVKAEPSGGWTVTKGDRFLSVQGGGWYLDSPIANECTKLAPDQPVSSDGGSVSSTGCAVVTYPAGSSGGGSAGSPPTEPAPPQAPSSQDVQRCEMPPCPPGQSCIQSCPEPGPDDKPIEPYPLPPEPVRPAGLPSEAEALAKARGIFTAAGLDLTGANLQVVDGFSTVDVQVDRLQVDGTPVNGVLWSLSFGPQNALVRGNGTFLDATKLGDYPLIGVDAGFERLKSGQYGYGYGARDAMTLEAPAPDCGAPNVLCDPPTIDCGGPASTCPAPEPIVHTVTGAHLVLEFAPSFDGTSPSYLVPSYAFDIEDGSIGQVMALPDEYIEQLQPSPQPVPDIQKGAPTQVEPGFAPYPMPSPETDTAPAP